MLKKKIFLDVYQGESRFFSLQKKAILPDNATGRLLFSAVLGRQLLFLHKYAPSPRTLLTPELRTSNWQHVANLITTCTQVDSIMLLSR